MTTDADRPGAAGSGGSRGAGNVDQLGSRSDSQNDSRLSSEQASPWASVPQLPPCCPHYAFITASHIVALASKGCVLVAVRPFYVSVAPHEGWRWRMEPADAAQLPPSVVDFVFEAGDAAIKLAENSAALAREADKQGRGASVLIWRHRRVVRAIAREQVDEMYIGAERLRELLQPVMIETAGKPQ